MKKFIKIFSFVLLLLVATFNTGCGELTFEETPYGPSKKNAEAIVTYYNEAYAGTLDLSAKYEGESVHTQGDVVTKTKLKYIVGKLGNENYASIEEKVTVNGIPTGTTTTVYYQDTKFVINEVFATGTTTKTSAFYRTTNVQRETLVKIFPILYAESIETTGHKEYNEEQYYRIVLYKNIVNDEFSDPIIIKPEGTFVSHYSYAFGVNKKGYLSYIVHEYTLIDSSNLETAKDLATFTSTIKLVPPYGPSSMTVIPPNPSDFVPEGSEPVTPEPPPAGGES